MTKSKIFFILSLFFIGGVAVASFYYPKILSSNSIYLLVVLALITLVVFWSNKKSVIFSLAFLFFLLGMFLVSGKLEKIKNLSEEEKNFSSEVMIAKEPVIKDKIQTLVLEPLTQTSNVHNGHSMSTLFLLNANVYEEYKYGEVLKINCELQRIKNFDNSFDYRMYLGKDGIFYECKKPEIERLNKNEGNGIYLTLLKIKNKFEENINKLIPAPESGLLIGLILGGSDQLSKNIKDNFSRTGMTHIVAVSGYNVTIIAEYLMILGIFLGLWRRQAFWFAVTGIILFVIITGLSASAVRAGIMGILLIWAMKNGRLANSENAILFSAGAMLLSNPLLLRWDIGFQLSFLATIGIVYFYPIAENYLIKNHKAFGITEILFLSISAQIFVLPIIMFNFGTLSLISLLANILILPIIPFTMLLGFVSALFGFIFEPVAIIFSWLAYLPLKYETLIINYLGSLKYASVEMKITWIGVAVWYIILVGIIIIVKNKNKEEL
ncbi:MAG TPA: ComEC/Rec2 family competence protein [Candidatus Moranbacteria bacterium]|nr:ComEC/Rec2 family competence protein [Candidatus Moranbacteria bacterium]